jgi:hypothetical protein
MGALNSLVQGMREPSRFAALRPDQPKSQVFRGGNRSGVVRLSTAAPASDKARLLDFEFSAPGDLLLHAVYWQLGFPTCCCAGVNPEDGASPLTEPPGAIDSR